MYLLNPNKPKSVAHLWNGSDTFCRMYSTGGLRKKKQIVSESTLGKKVCTMCQNVGNRSFHMPSAGDIEYARDVDNFSLRLPNI